MSRRHLALLCALALGAAAPEADAAPRLVVKGHGFGHGVGMSQYGAYGYARNGQDHRFILRHYYTGTEVARLGAAPEVGVLLAGGRRSASFTRATSAAGRLKLDPRRTYRVVPNGLSGTLLRSPGGRVLGRTDGALRVSGPPGRPVTLLGRAGFGLTNARYRGALEFRPSSVAGLNVINAVGLEDYVRGVVGGESPASWPAEALEAQAVAARTYAITTNAGGAAGFTQYSDTRSQVYKGVTAETASTDAAVEATHEEVVTYAGKPVTTFFFSSSGGQTENVENSFLKSPPRPWLKGVEDPYDGAAPRHDWRISMSLRSAESRLHGLVKGSLRAITVVQRGASPRIVRASVVGTRGRTTVDGPTLRSRLGLYDTWAAFTVTGVNGAPKPNPEPKPKPPAPAPAPGLGGDPSGGAGPG